MFKVFLFGEIEIIPAEIIYDFTHSTIEISCSVGVGADAGLDSSELAAISIGALKMQLIGGCASRIVIDIKKLGTSIGEILRIDRQNNQLIAENRD